MGFFTAVIGGVPGHPLCHPAGLEDGAVLSLESPKVAE